MTLRLLRRLTLLLISLFAASVLIFGFMAVLPGDPARVALGVNSSEAAVTQLRSEFGLDRPVLERYLDWIGGFLTFDLGLSWISRTPIAPLIGDRVARPRGRPGSSRPLRTPTIRAGAVPCPTR